MRSFFRNFWPQATLAIVMALVLGFVTLAAFGPTAVPLLALVAVAIAALIVMVSIRHRASAESVVPSTAMTRPSSRGSTASTSSAVLRPMMDREHSVTHGGSGANNGMVLPWLTWAFKRAWDTATSKAMSMLGLGRVVPVAGAMT